MPQFNEGITIDATPEAVWPHLIDVERWPSWTASVTEARRLDGQPLGPGSRVWIKQPRLVAGTWTVTAWEPEAGFTWESRQPGLHLVAEHWLDALPGGASRLSLKVQMGGWLSGVTALLAASLTRRYLRLEAEGLRERCEGRR